MGHCYVADPKTGKFIGMVCTNSLTPYRKPPKSEVHASDCPYWISEPCNCVLGKDAN
jgi:hypothetical protein